MNYGRITNQHLTAPNYLVVAEKLQQVDSDALEATPSSQAAIIQFLVVKVRRLKYAHFYRRHMSLISTHTQRLMQLGYSLGTLEDVMPPIFLWILFTVNEKRRASLKRFRSILEILLNLGADINARWRQYPPLIYFFRHYTRLDKGDKASKTRKVTAIVIALLEKGADPLALHDSGLSVFNMAEDYGWTFELALALQETGYDLDEVRQETELAQLIFFDMGVSLAESTAVDIAHMEEPSGLISRRAIAGDRLEE